MSSFFTDAVTAPDAPSMRLLRRCRSRPGTGETRCVQTVTVLAENTATTSDATPEVAAETEVKTAESSGTYAFDELEVTHKRQTLPDLSEHLDELTEPHAAPRFKLAKPPSLVRQEFGSDSVRAQSQRRNTASLPDLCDPAEERTQPHARKILQDFPVPTIADLSAPTDVYRRETPVRDFARPKAIELSMEDERTTPDVPRSVAASSTAPVTTPSLELCTPFDSSFQSPILLTRRTDAWVDELPEAARKVLHAAAFLSPASFPRLAGAVATPVERLSAVPTAKYQAIKSSPDPAQRLPTAACFAVDTIPAARPQR